MTFGERMTMFRRRKKISQFELAEILGTSQTLICAYENDKSEPTAHRIQEICKALDVTATDLIGV